jgi:two-component system, OmpR family, response regulator
MARAMGPRSVLVVDDDGATRSALQALLHDEGYVVMTAASGGEALAILRSIRPDLVLLDLRLPDLGGAQVLDRLTHMGAQVRVLTMSASPMPVDLSGHFPVVGHMVKPFDIDELLDVTAHAVA